MRAEFVAVVCAVAAVAAGVRHWEMRSASPGPQLPQPQQAAPVASAEPARPAPAARAVWADEVRIPATRDNQFLVAARVNDAPASFLIDTGAGHVALRESVARAAGVHVAWTDYTHPVRTANGEAMAALVTLKAIEVGPLRVVNVTAFVLADELLSVNLLGMSFLSRLESVEARGGEMILKG
jgi:aspartyl protease family protein